MAALRNKKTKELELDRIAGTRLTLETQVCVYLLLLGRFLYRYPRDLQQRCESKENTANQQVNALESANLNAETMLAMKKGSEALKGIHTSLYVFF
jgi:charged multivesicular body protein 4